MNTTQLKILSRNVEIHILSYFFVCWDVFITSDERDLAAKSWKSTWPREVTERLSQNWTWIPSLSFVYDQLIAITRGSASAQVNIFIQSDTESLGPRSYHISTRLTKKFRFARLSERGSTQCIPEDCSPSVIETLEFFPSLFFTSQVSSSFQVAILSSVLRTLRLHSPVDIVVCIYMNMLRLHSPVDIVVCWKFFFFYMNMD